MKESNTSVPKNEKPRTISDYKGDWWSCPTESETSNNTIIVTGRRDVDKFRKNPKFSIRVEISLPYTETPGGMPSKDDEKLIADITDRLAMTFEKDPVAVMTGIYSGDNQRDWVFYTLSTNIFQKKLNEALADLPLVPLRIYAENDPEWNEYSEMRQATEMDSSD